jgi:hypothetical protein
MMTKKIKPTMKSLKDLAGIALAKEVTRRGHDRRNREGRLRAIDRIQLQSFYLRHKGRHQKGARAHHLRFWLTFSVGRQSQRSEWQRYGNPGHEALRQLPGSDSETRFQ